MVIILVAGKAGSGKDTVADYVVKKYSFVKLAFADALKEYVSKKYKINKELMYTQQGKKSLFNKKTTIRQLLISEATIKREEDEDFWVNILIAQIKKEPHKKYIISDFRFPNEYYSLYRHFSSIYTIEVYNPNVKQINDPTETSLKNFHFDYCITNDSTLKDLYKKIDFNLLI